MVKYYWNILFRNLPWEFFRGIEKKNVNQNQSNHKFFENHSNKMEWNYKYYFSVQNSKICKY